MNAQKVPKFQFREIIIGVVLGVSLPILLSSFRFTAAIAFLIFVLVWIFFRMHRSRRALDAAFVLFAAAISVPVDVYVPGWHGPLSNSAHSGLRYVPVLYGLGAHRTDGGEYISGGCVVGMHDTRWRIVWD